MFKGKNLLVTLIGFMLGLIVKIEAAETKISGVIFADFNFVLSEYLKSGTTAYNINSFDVSRAYLNADAKFTDTIKGFVQYEVNLITLDGTSNSVYLKQALLEIKDIYPDAKIMFGLIPNPWRGYEEGIWKHRFVAKILDDIEGFFPATDRGVRLNAKASIVEYDLGIYNGEGTKSNESNKYKDYIGKIAVSPFTEEQVKGLKLNLYYHKGNYDTDLPRDRILAGVSYESKKVNAMLTSYNADTKKVKSDGISVHSVLNLTEKEWVFARYDLYDPDKDKTDDARSRMFLGLGYKITDGVRATVDYQSLTQEKETSTSRNQSILFWHLEVKF